MILIRALAAPFIIAAVLLCCCGDFGDVGPIFFGQAPVEIVGGYSLGRPLAGGLQLYGPGPHAIVGQSVVNIGWDEEFILVEQHPLVGSTGDPRHAYPRWHIIIVSSGKHFSWRSYDDFLFLRDTVLHVPKTIEMRDAREVYYGD